MPFNKTDSYSASLTPFFLENRRSVLYPNILGEADQS